MSSENKNLLIFCFTISFKIIDAMFTKLDSLPVYSFTLGTGINHSWATVQSKVITLDKASSLS